MSKKLVFSCQWLSAWLVHLFTATAAVMGLMTLICLHHHRYLSAMCWMLAAVLVDALDGTFARLLKVKTVLPELDGALLDNMVDFLNYVITPCFFLYIKPGLLPESAWGLSLSAVIISSAYQFCQVDAKTPDHFFKGFPCYWNIILFYMLMFNTPALVNQAVLLLLSLCVFIPIKYIYPSRLGQVIKSSVFRWGMYGLTLLYTLSFVWIFFSYPQPHPAALIISSVYAVFYVAMSFYYTFSAFFKFAFWRRSGIYHS